MPSLSSAVTEQAPSLSTALPSLSVACWKEAGRREWRSSGLRWEADTRDDRLVVAEGGETREEAS